MHCFTLRCIALESWISRTKIQGFRKFFCYLTSELQKGNSILYLYSRVYNLPSILNALWQFSRKFCITMSLMSCFVTKAKYLRWSFYQKYLRDRTYVNVRLTYLQFIKYLILYTEEDIILLINSFHKIYIFDVQNKRKRNKHEKNQKIIFSAFLCSTFKK